MFRFLSIIALFIACQAVAFAAPAHQPTRVIYITLDGTRWQDIFVDRTYFPKLWSCYAANGIFYGAPNSNTTMEVASIPISLPSYQSQMSGAVQPCNGNGCGRIKVETLTEKLIHSGFQKKDVATFASWPYISYAVEHVDGTTFSNTGNTPVYDLVTRVADAVMSKLNLTQLVKGPSDPYREDKCTYAQAMNYLEKYQPRFLWIALCDADNHAHAADIVGYHQTLSFYDDALDQLFNKLKAMHLDQDTMVIVTTDHGRGNGVHWTSHGPEYPESKQTWAFVMNGELVPVAVNGNVKKYSTLSVRPTIERVFGIRN